MYERFTDRARKVMQLANQEAQRFNHEYIGTEHILLGLVKEGSGVAANVLKNLDVDLLEQVANRFAAHDGGEGHAFADQLGVLFLADDRVFLEPGVTRIENHVSFAVQNAFKILQADV